LDGALQTLVLISALPIYWFFAIRRFYGLKSFVSAGAAIILTASQSAVAFALNIVVFAVLIRAI
jgi:hypothetical protein